MTTLLAAFAIERSLASGAIGAGLAIAGGTLWYMVKPPPEPDPGVPLRRVPFARGMLLIAIGMALIVVGVLWRMSVVRA